MFIGPGNYKINSVKENGPLSYSPPTAVRGEPGTMACSMSSKVLPAVDCILVVPHFEGRGGIHNLDTRRSLCTH